MDLFSQFSIDPEHDTSLSFQIKQQITWWIINGTLKPGDKLPSIHQLSRKLGINLHTVRSAYHKLESEGLVETVRSRGTHVLAYHPLRIALVAGNIRSHTVGVILPSFTNPFYHALLRGIEEIAEEDQTMIFICNTHDDPNLTWRHYARLVAKQVDGIVVVSDDLSAYFSQENKQTIPPIVTIDWPGADGYCVQFDLESVGRQATKHLVEHGHHRIGLITFAQDSVNVLPVVNGYLNVLKEAGITFQPEWIARVPNFDMASGALGAQKLLALANPPTAIFTIADTLALGALDFIKQAGLNIPEDIALVSFNDIPAAALVDPPLTTVVAPAAEAGKAAMRLLHDLIEGNNPSQRQYHFLTHLVVRQSCGRHESSS
ncbi:MAG: hypothetical protein CVU46_11350 [Chloroflexi bacterium HGW-Chloroflexi-8]|nr:MAG: hypothetical protein CVU46_11350 [Chloroflexi bacterium HGW-Chloroflexi-8]